jgi:hypothetical protein
LRSYRHDVAEIATALVSIGRGSSYRQAAIRAAAGSQLNGQLVANWVRAFGPVVSAPHEPLRWPSVLGVGAFTLRHGPAGGGLLIQMAVASAPAGRPHRLWDARLATRGRLGEWKSFFERGSGRPDVLVVERGTEAAAIALQVWAEDPPRLIESRRRIRLNLSAHSRPGTTEAIRTTGTTGMIGAAGANGATEATHFADGDIDRLVTMFAERRDALIRRLGTRQAHFRSHAQLESLLRLMRIDVNGDADAVEYAECILAAAATG